MGFKRVLDYNFWHINKGAFSEAYRYDLKLNAEFRGHCDGVLSNAELKLPQIKYLRLYRLAQAAQGTIWSRYYMYLLRRYSFKTGIGLYENMNIPKGLIIGHEGRIVINGAATFKGNIFLTHGVTIGRDVRGKRKGAPTFGKDVSIRCNSTVVGKIVIGDDVFVIGNPATIHHRDWATEGHLGKGLV